MSEHTPGAIRAATQIQGFVNQGAGHKLEAVEHKLMTEWIDEETAAPDLLEAAELTNAYLRDHLKDTAAGKIRGMVANQKLRAAIAKARREG